MMQHHINAMRQAAMAQSMERAGMRLGTVSGYDASNFLAKVILQPEGTETGWLPISAVAVGNGWGIQAAPNIGDMVEVEFAESGIDAGLITGRFFSDSNRPGAVPSGEFWLVHQSGSYLKFTSNGNVLLHAAANLTVDAPNGVLRLTGQDVQVHASGTYRFDANGQGQKWNGTSVETWQDNDAAGPHHNHSPPEIS